MSTPAVIVAVVFLALCAVAGVVIALAHGNDDINRITGGGK